MDLRMQSFDSRLASALDDVPVPDGLAGRLLARLGEAAETPPIGGVVSASSPLNQPVVATAAVLDAAVPGGVVAESATLPMQRASRRRWLVVTGSLAASVLVAPAPGNSSALAMIPTPTWLNWPPAGIRNWPVAGTRSPRFRPVTRCLAPWRQRPKAGNG